MRQAQRERALGDKADTEGERALGDKSILICNVKDNIVCVCMCVCVHRNGWMRR